MNVRRFLGLAMACVLFLSALFGGAGGAIFFKAEAASATCTEHASDDGMQECHGDCDGISCEKEAAGIYDGALLNAVLEKSRYEEGEQIVLRLEALSAAAGKEFSYTSVGFSVLNDTVSTFFEDTGVQGYQLLLVYDGVTEAPKFTFEVVTDTGMSAYAEVFGYLAEDALFVSKNSYDAAKEASYYHLVQNGWITMEEFNALLQWDHSREGVEVVEMTEDRELSDSLNGTGESFAASGTTRISGTLTWKDDRGIGHPMQYNTVEIWDELANKKLGTVYTDVSGRYSFAISGSTTYNIYIKVYPGGENAIVKTGVGGTYVYKSSTKSNVTPGANVNINWTVDMTSDLGRAIQVSQAINVATKYVKQMSGSYITQITVYYPHVESNSGCFYNGSIYICGSSAVSGRPASYASWDVVMHEYGHHVQRAFKITQSPGGSHSFTQNLADSRGSKDLGIRLAWGESYPSVFGAMAQQYYISSLQNIVTVGDAQYTSYNGAYLDYETPSAYKGEACEASVIGVLWDLYDNTSSEPHDAISFTPQAYWDLITGSGAKTLSDFSNYFNKNSSGSQAFAFGSLLSYHGVSASGLWASYATTLPTIDWTANGTSTGMLNNKFDLIIFDEEYQEIFRVQGITGTSYTITQADQGNMQNWACGLRYAVVVAYQTSSPTTGGYYSAPIEIGKNHNYADWSETLAPTCIKEGQERRDCKSCNVYQLRSIDALGHDYDEGVVVPPQCEEKGYVLSECQRCGVEGKSNFVAALGHDRRTIATVEAQCETMGYVLSECQRCGEEYKSKYVAAKGHAGTEWILTQAPTKRAFGEEQLHCQRCAKLLETRTVEPYTYLIAFETKVKSLTGECNEASFDELVSRLNYYEKLGPLQKEAVREDYELLCTMIEAYNANATARNQALVQGDERDTAEASDLLADVTGMLNGVWYSLCEKTKGRGATV